MNHKFGITDEFEIVEKLSPTQIEQLHELVQEQWWGSKRTLTEVQVMVDNTSLMLGLVERESKHLMGYCRVLTDFVFRATIYDVMVTSSMQGRGLGRLMMDTLLEHPKIQNVSLIYLACEPNMYSFYEQWGFSPYDGRAQWMIKVQKEE